MITRITDMNIGEQTHLPSYNELSMEICLSAEAHALVLSSREVAQNIILGKDERQLLIVGPCSVHNPAEVLEVAKLISEIMKIKQDKYFIVMRVCFDKPRTGKDWLGFASDPHLDGTCDIAYGYRYIRILMNEILNLGVPIACEMMDISNYNIVSDMVSYAWVGARDAGTSRTRKDATSVTAPVGVKNSNKTDTLTDTIHALDVITKPNVMACPGNDGVHSRIATKGNQFAHLILRGGHSGPNYGSEQVKAARAELKQTGFNDRILIDCSHGNVNGDYKKQIDIFKDVTSRIKNGEEGIIGLMMEVYLEEGQQKVKLGVPGAPELVKPRVSVTDKCLSFVEFEAAFKQVLGIS